LELIVNLSLISCQYAYAYSRVEEVVLILEVLVEFKLYFFKLQINKSNSLF